MTRREKRIQALEHRLKPARDHQLKQWMSTLSREDVDLLAAAAERVKAGDHMRFDTPDLQRLESDYQTFVER